MELQGRTRGEGAGGISARATVPSEFKVPRGHGSWTDLVGEVLDLSSAELADAPGAHDSITFGSPVTSRWARIDGSLAEIFEVAGQAHPVPSLRTWKAASVLRAPARHAKGPELHQLVELCSAERAGVLAAPRGIPGSRSIEPDAATDEGRSNADEASSCPTANEVAPLVILATNSPGSPSAVVTAGKRPAQEDDREVQDTGTRMISRPSSDPRPCADSPQPHSNLHPPPLGRVHQMGGNPLAEGLGERRGSTSPAISRVMRSARRSARRRPWHPRR